jgi:hypothetical protein
MANPLRNYEASGPVPVRAAPEAVPLERPLARGRVHQAFRILQLGFVAAPIIAGVDKFFHALVNWDQYLAPVIPGTLGIDGHIFMLGVGVVEIVAGVGVALVPRVFGYVVGAWLLGIVGNLLLTGQYYDIALRDFGLALGALALGRLAEVEMPAVARTRRLRG